MAANASSLSAGHACGFRPTFPYGSTPAASAWCITASTDAPSFRPVTGPSTRTARSEMAAGPWCSAYDTSAVICAAVRTHAGHERAATAGRSSVGARVLRLLPYNFAPTTSITSNGGYGNAAKSRGLRAPELTPVASASASRLMAGTFMGMCRKAHGTSPRSGRVFAGASAVA